MTLFPYQLDGVRFLREHPGALLADEMGLGKTVQAIELINADPNIQTVLVVCPATMKLVWKRELEKWLVRKLEVALVDVCSRPAVPAQVLIINYDRLHQHRDFLCFQSWDLAIFDECHYLKNPESRRTKIATAIKANRRLALSGTPLLNRPVELLPVLTWLDPVNWSRNKWHEFGLRYCGGSWNGFGWEYIGATNLAELSTRLRSTVMLRRTKAEVLPSLPAKFRSVIELSANSNLRRLVQAELWAFERWMEVQSGASSGPTGDGYQTSVKNLHRYRGETRDNLAKARHETALAKVPLVAEYVRELFKGGSGKVVIFGHHRDVISQLATEHLEFGPVTLTGGTPTNVRVQEVERFRSDPQVRVFIGNIQAAGIGITLAPASSHCVFAEVSWVPAEMTQAEDRLHRIGTRDNVLVQHLVLEGSLDAIMIRRLIKKQEILSQVLETENPSELRPSHRGSSTETSMSNRRS
jgi:SWI/SNF-related matrix-associated actin-dependent regulator of chromatin subfamily A-like protein 1